MIFGGHGFGNFEPRWFDRTLPRETCFHEDSPYFVCALRRAHITFQGTPEALDDFFKTNISRTDSMPQRTLVPHRVCVNCLERISPNQHRIYGLAGLAGDMLSFGELHTDCTRHATVQRIIDRQNIMPRVDMSIRDGVDFFGQDCLTKQQYFQRLVDRRRERVASMA